MSAFVINSYAFGGEDPDAKAYLDAVESADTQALEAAVRKAVDDFVKGCKADGIWTAIQECCILAGARTLDGALTPLKGSAPTNNGPFVAGDYNRETGLLGNGSSKFLTTARLLNTLTVTNSHAAISWTTLGNGVFYGNFNTGRIDVLNFGAARHGYSGGGGGTMPATVSSAGLVGTNRSVAAASYTVRVNQTNFTASHNAAAFSAEPLRIFRSGISNAYSTARMTWYSIGRSLALADLDTRVSTLITDIDAAI